MAKFSKFDKCYKKLIGDPFREDKSIDILKVLSGVLCTVNIIFIELNTYLNDFFYFHYYPNFDLMHNYWDS